jgi:HNH endonuclease
MRIPARMRAEVIRRADGRCEYCQLSQAGQEAVFHVDHIQPLVHGGMTELPNLALACVSCSLRKGARTTAKDPKSGKQAPLFHPRDWRWTDHFRWIGVRVEGISPTGRATVALLRMNREIAVAIRAEEVRLGRHPEK